VQLQHPKIKRGVVEQNILIKKITPPRAAVRALGNSRLASPEKTLR
jgi:hypothetical protein